MKQIIKISQITIGIFLIIAVISVLLLSQKGQVKKATTESNTVPKAIDKSTEPSTKPVDNSEPIQNMQENANHISSPAAKTEKYELPLSAPNPEIYLQTKTDNTSMKEDDKAKSKSDLPEHVMRWREIVTHFDDLYSVSQVREIRNRYLDDYCKTSLKASHAENRKELKEGRAAAKTILAEGTKELEKVYEVYTKVDDKAQYEALLAIGELLYKNDDCNKAIISCEQALKGLTKDRLKAQAYYYMSQCYAKLQKMDECKKCEQIIALEFPKEAKEIHYRQSSRTIEGLMREVAFCYESAEKYHFMAYQAPNKKNAEKLIELRDKMLSFSVDMFNMEIMRGGEIMSEK